MLSILADSLFPLYPLGTEQRAQVMQVDGSLREHIDCLRNGCGESSISVEQYTVHRDYEQRWPGAGFV